jgi:hypothetical protein
MKKLIGTITTLAIILGLPPTKVLSSTEWLQAQVNVITIPPQPKVVNEQPRAASKPSGGTSSNSSGRTNPNSSGRTNTNQNNRTNSSAVSSRRKPSTNQTNEMAEYLSDWGYSVTPCRGEVAKITNIVTKEVACVRPNRDLEAGEYTYHPAGRSILSRRVDVEEYNRLIAENDLYFNNAYEYGTCLDAILLAYEGRERELERLDDTDCVNNVIDNYGTTISRDTALQLIQLAHYRAITFLPSDLYPTLGLRERIALDLGYLYDIDKDNPTILERLDEYNRRRS